MNPEIKAKWVAALRSGKYKQSQEVLRDCDGFCCLGVLCEISKAETGFGIDEVRQENGGDENLGETVMNWAYLMLEDGAVVSIDGTRAKLPAHNDSGKTFAQIADAIEEQL